MSESRPKRSVRNKQPIVAEPEPAPVASSSGRRLKKAPIISSSSSKSSKTLKSPKVPKSSPKKQTKVTTKASKSPQIVASSKSTISPKKQTKVTTKTSRSPKIVENSSKSTKVSISSKLKSVPSLSSSSRTKPTKSSKEPEKVSKKSSKDATEKVLKKLPNGGKTKAKSQTNNGHNEEQDQDLMNSTFDILQGNSTGRKGRGGVTTTNSKASKPSIVDKNSDQIDSIFAKLKGWKIQISEGENRLETMLKKANIDLNGEQQQSKVGDQKMPDQSNSAKVDGSDLSNKQLEALGFDLNYGIIDDVINKIDKLVEEEALSTSTIDDHHRSQSSNCSIRKQIDSAIDLIWTERYNILGRNFPKNHDSVDESRADNAMKEENVIDDEISIDPIKYRELYLQNVIEPLELELVDRLYFGVEMDDGDSSNLSNIDYKMDTYVRNPFQFYQLFLWKRLWMFRNRNFPSIIESFDQSHRSIRQQLDRYYRRLQLESSSSSSFDELSGELCHREDLDFDRQCFTVFYHYFRKNIDETLKIFDQDSHRPSRAEMMAVNLFLIQNNLVLFDLFHKILLNLLELKTSNSNGAYDEPISCCISLQFSNSKSFAIKSLLCLFNFLAKLDHSGGRKFANYGEMISMILEQFAETVLALVGDEHYQLFRQLFRQFPLVQRGMNLEQKLCQFSMFIKLLPQSTIQCYLPQVLAMICRLIIKKNGDEVNGEGNMAVEIAEDEEEEEIQLITNLRDVYPLMQTVLMGKNQNNLMMNSPNKTTSAISSAILDQLVKILYVGFSKFNNFDSHTPKMLDHFLSCHRQLTKETKEMVLLIKYKVSNELINN